MGQFNLGDVAGFGTDQIGEIGGLNSFAGSMAGSAATFAMTGNATFNLARIKGVGIFEMSVGKDGMSSRLGFFPKLVEA